MNHLLLHMSPGILERSCIQGVCHKAVQLPRWPVIKVSKAIRKILTSSVIIGAARVVGEIFQYGLPEQSFFE